MSHLRGIIITDAAGNETTLEPNGSVPVTLQDQTTPPVLVDLNKVEQTTYLTAATAIDDKTITVNDATGFTLGKFVVIANVAENRYYTGHVTSASGNPVSLTGPLDFAYPLGVGSQVTAGITDMSVNGSVTPQIFSLRASDPGLPLVVDVTRIVIRCTTATAVSLDKLGDIAGGVLNGIQIRTVNGTYQNVVNFRTNYDIAGTMFDWNPYEATNPSQGIDGFVARLTFSGQDKLGVAIRVAEDEDFEAIVQDDLSTITSLHIKAEGSVVQG